MGVNNRLSVIKKAMEIVGPRTLLLIIAPIPTGFIIGILEILFSISLLYFLSNYNLLPATNLPAWFLLFAIFGPVATFVCIAIIKQTFFFLLTLLTDIGRERFHIVIRNYISRLLFLRGSMELKLSVADVSTFFSSLLPKATMFVSNTVRTVSNLLTLLATLGGLFILSYKFAFISLLIIAVFAFPIIFTRKLFQKYSANIYAKTDEFFKRILKDLRNIYFLRIVGKNISELDALTEINRSIFSSQLKYIFGITLNSTLPVLAGIGIVVALVLVNHQFNLVAGSILVPFIYLLYKSFQIIGIVITGSGYIQFNWPFFKNLVQILEWAKDDDVKNMTNKVALRIGRFESLKASNLAIGRSSVILNDIYFAANPGDFIYISGESGKGKTTLLMTLIGLIPYIDGEILWNKVPIDHIDSNDLKSRIAYSGADPFLLDIPVRDNILFGSEKVNYSDTQIWDILQITGCDFVNKLPNELSYLLKEGGEGISAGQKQRLSIARAVLRKPEVLILDEATANIDVEMEYAILSNIKEYLPQCLILAVSHRESVGKFATTKIVL